MLADLDILNKADNSIEETLDDQSKLSAATVKEQGAADGNPDPSRVYVLMKDASVAGGKFPPGVRLLNYWIKE
jgi:hypothetical protein